MDAGEDSGNNALYTSTTVFNGEEEAVEQDMGH